MRQVILKTACHTPGQENRIAQLTRHLSARLQDFGPGGPQVLDADQKSGFVSVRFPGDDTRAVAAQLEQTSGILVALEDDCAVFYLSPNTRFEDLDYVWGCLFNIL